MFAPPGPPLPSNHPSPTLLAKLYLHVTRLYNSSRALFKAHASDPSSSTTRRLFRSDKIEEPDSAEGGLLAGFKRYLKKEALLSQALAHKWLGVDAGENGKGARVGEAICLCKSAQSRLQDMEDGALREKMKGFGIGKSNEKRKEERKARKGRVERDLEDVIAWVKSYTRQNDTVSRRERVAAHGRSPFSPYLQSTRLLFRPVDRSSQQRHTNHLHRRLVSQSLIKKMVNPQRQRRPTIMLAKGHISDTWV
jgi:hypothetical protein